MARFIRRMRSSVVLTTVLCFLQAFPPSLFAESPVKMQKMRGSIDVSGPGPVYPVTLEGVASHLGQFTAAGEVQLTPGQQPGSFVGQGIIVITASNGDLLVGVISWQEGVSNGNARRSEMHFSWRDSVTFSNGTVVSNTGRFVTTRPPGAIIGFEYLLVSTLLVIGLFGLR